MSGVGEYFARGALLHHLTRVHDGDFVCQAADECQVVGHKDHGKTEFLTQVVEQLHNLVLHGHVESSGGFVGDEQPRIAGQRHGDEYALTDSSCG